MSGAGERQERHLSGADVLMMLEEVVPGSVFKPGHPTALKLSSESKRASDSSSAGPVEHRSRL